MNQRISPQCPLLVVKGDKLRQTAKTCHSRPGLFGTIKCGSVYIAIDIGIDIHVLSIASDFEYTNKLFYNFMTSLHKKTLVHSDKCPVTLTCPNFFFIGTRQVLM
jgi:hypothetical protein